ncbi:hypothetical protein GCM10023157_04700 [Gluconacetobacter asukensis]
MAPADLLGMELPPHAKIYREGDVLAAVMPISDGAWEVHCGAAPDRRGRIALEAFRRLIAQFWSDYPDAITLIGVMEATHRAARVNAVRLGFIPFLTDNLPWPDGSVRLTACYRLERAQS